MAWQLPAISLHIADRWKTKKKLREENVRTRLKIKWKTNFKESPVNFSFNGKMCQKLLSVSLTMSGILWADWLGRGHPDKVLPFLTRIYLAVKDKHDTAGTQWKGVAHKREKKQPTKSIKLWDPGREARRSKGPTVFGDGTSSPQTSTLWFELHSIQKHFCPRSFGSRIQCRAHTQLPLKRLPTLCTLAELLWDEEGNSSPVKDKRLFD